METLHKTSTQIESPYSPKDLEYFKNLILDKRNEAAEEIEYLQSVLENIRYTDEADNSSNAHHIADLGSEEENTALYYALIQRTRKFVGQLDRALERIENGTYGICHATGKPIPKGRLEAVPHTRYSINAKLKGLDKQFLLA